MALSNYTELQASIASWLNRSDQATNIPDFVALAESSIASDVRLRELVTVSTLTTVANQDYVTLPTDWLEFKYIKFDKDPLEFIPADRLRARNEETGDLAFYSIEGSRLLLNPTPTAVVTLDIAYYAKLAALTVTPTNTLLTKHPQIYLCKALAWAFKFLMNDERSQYWDGLYQEAVARAVASDKAGLISGSPLRVRIR